MLREVSKFIIFQTLFKILEKIGFNWSKKCSHLSYGMVDLPSGKMKSREGTVVDADDLILKMRNESLKLIQSSNKFDDFDKEEILELSKIVGDGALKYFILKVDAKKICYLIQLNQLILMEIQVHLFNIHMRVSSLS